MTSHQLHLFSANNERKRNAAGEGEKNNAQIRIVRNGFIFIDSHMTIDVAGSKGSSSGKTAKNIIYCRL